jgi:hypothetical protein
MAHLSMVESQAVAELAEALYDFLPATFSSVTWPDVAARFDLHGFWPGTSKRQSIPILLTNVLQHRTGATAGLSSSVKWLECRILNDNPRPTLCPCPAVSKERAGGTP